MTKTPLIYRWRCLDCEARATGTQAEVQRAAETHTKREAHSTVAGTTTPTRAPHPRRRAVVTDPDEPIPWRYSPPNRPNRVPSCEHHVETQGHDAWCPADNGTDFAETGR